MRLHDDDPWGGHLLGPVREEPDFEAEAAWALAEHEAAEHGGQPCDCPPEPWPDPDPGVEAPF